LLTPGIRNVRTETKNLPGSIFDISEGGVALSTKEAIPTTKMLNIDFALQDGDDHHIRCNSME
jgi:PilZ domain